MFKLLFELFLLVLKGEFNFVFFEVFCVSKLWELVYLFFLFCERFFLIELFVECLCFMRFEIDCLWLLEFFV